MKIVISTIFEEKVSLQIFNYSKLWENQKLTTTKGKTTTALCPHLIFSTGPTPSSGGTGDLGLQGEQGVKQHPGFSDLARDVSVEMLAKHLRVLGWW